MGGGVGTKQGWAVKEIAGMIFKRLRLHQQVWEGCFCGMRDLGKSNCCFFALSYVKHSLPTGEGCQQLGMVKLKGIKCG